MLKTLKDITFRESPQLGENFEPIRKVHNQKNEWINHDDLKQEAIKWINELTPDGRYNPAVAWIKHFFNITDDDLNLNGGKTNDR